MVKEHLRLDKDNFLGKAPAKIPKWVDTFLNTVFFEKPVRPINLTPPAGVHISKLEKIEAGKGEQPPKFWLKKVLRERNQSTSGKKDELIARINEMNKPYAEITRIQNHRIGNFKNYPQLKEIFDLLAEDISKEISIEEDLVELQKDSYYFRHHSDQCCDEIIIEFLRPRGPRNVTSVKITVIRKSNGLWSASGQGFKFQIYDDGAKEPLWEGEYSMLHRDKVGVFSPYIKELCQHSLHEMPIIH